MCQGVMDQILMASSRSRSRSNRPRRVHSRHASEHMRMRTASELCRNLGVIHMFGTGGRKMEPMDMDELRGESVMVLVLGTVAVAVPSVAAKLLHVVYVAMEPHASEETQRRCQRTSSFQNCNHGVGVFDASEYVRDLFVLGGAAPVDMNHFQYLGPLLACNTYALWRHALEACHAGHHVSHEGDIMASCSSLLRHLQMPPAYGLPGM